MSGKRAPPSYPSLHVVDIFIVGVLLLIYHVHVDEARPPGERERNILNTRWQEIRGHNAQRLGANNNNHPVASLTPSSHGSANHQTDRSSVILPSNRDDNTDRAISDDGSIFSVEGENSGDGSIDEHDSNDDNEDGDDDDYDEGREEDIEAGSGHHEPKDTTQSTSHGDSHTNNFKIDEEPTSESTSAKPTTTSATSKEPSTNDRNYLPTTIKPELVGSIENTPRPTTQQATTTTLTSTTNSWNPQDSVSSITTKRPWSSEMTSKLPDSSIYVDENSKLLANSTDNYEDEDEEDDNYDDIDDSSVNFEDNISPESETDVDKLNVHMPTSSSTTETHPTLQAIFSQTPTTTFKPSTVTEAPVEITAKPIASTAPTAIIRPSSSDKISIHTTIVPTTQETDDIDQDDDGESIDDDSNEDGLDDDDMDDDDLEDEDPDDDLDQGDSTTPSIPNNMIMDSTNTRAPTVILDSRLDRIDESNIVQETYNTNSISGQKFFELRSVPLLAHPVIILIVSGSIIAGLYVAILIVMFIVYRLRRQEEM